MSRYLALELFLAVSGCGTLSGLGHGAGQVFQGIGSDLSSLGDTFQR
jgi:predicted small secreted protein